MVRRPNRGVGNTSLNSAARETDVAAAVNPSGSAPRVCSRATGPAAWALLSALYPRCPQCTGGYLPYWFLTARRVLCEALPHWVLGMSTSWRHMSARDLHGTTISSRGRSSVDPLGTTNSSRRIVMLHTGGAAVQGFSPAFPIHSPYRSLPNPDLPEYAPTVAVQCPVISRTVAQSQPRSGTRCFPVMFRLVRWRNNSWVDNSLHSACL
jgi:hypothetical protein